MADIIEIDELESFVLDFLAYRREQRIKKPVAHTPKRIENKPDTVSHSTQASPISHSIGKGWPHYKIAGKGHVFTNQETRAASKSRDYGQASPISASHNDIIPALAPIVAQELSRFGPPTSPKALDHLINQIIASAMTLPPVSESIQTAEIKPWGRVALLQAVVELLIRISTM